MTQLRSRGSWEEGEVDAVPEPSGLAATAARRLLAMTVTAATAAMTAMPAAAAAAMYVSLDEVVEVLPAGGLPLPAWLTPLLDLLRAAICASMTALAVTAGPGAVPIVPDPEVCAAEGVAWLGWGSLAGAAWDCWAWTWVLVAGAAVLLAVLLEEEVALVLLVATAVVCTGGRSAGGGVLACSTRCHVLCRRLKLTPETIVTSGPARAASSPAVHVTCHTTRTDLAVRSDELGTTDACMRSCLPCAVRHAGGKCNRTRSNVNHKMDIKPMHMYLAHLRHRCRCDASVHVQRHRILQANIVSVLRPQLAYKRDQTTRRTAWYGTCGAD